MRISRRLKMGAHTVRVCRTKKRIEVNGDVVLGYSDPIGMRIVLATHFDGVELPETRQAEIYFHELMHMSARVCGIEIEEVQVSTLAAQMLDVIRENKIDLLDRS